MGHSTSSKVLTDRSRGRESEHWLTNRKSGIYYAVGMSERAFGPDRRTFPRFTGDDLDIGLRRRGRLGRVPGRVLDFNRFGIAVPIEQRLAEDEEVFVTWRHAEARLDNVVGVVHTCSPQEDGFRCGIQFRIQSKRQFDREPVEIALLSLERGFAGRSPSPDGPSAKTSASH